MENTDIRQLARTEPSYKYPRWAVALVVVGSMLVVIATAGLVALSLVQQDNVTGQPVSQSMSVKPYRV
jgi:hypothetical protein